MTTRNFRVNNGLEVGDIVISASTNTITGGATSAPSADGSFANKKYVDDQDAAIASDTLTMTNKTLTAPKFADAGFIADANGNEQIIFQTTSSAVNEFEITNGATGNGPILGASGETNVGIAITAKGSGDIDLNAGSDVNIAANKGLTFGNDGEKIEGDGTDLTIASSAKLNLTATSDVILPPNVGLIFDTAGAEKIESDGTDLSISVGANGDINIPADIGLTFGNDGEKIEGDGTDLTISGNNINLTATADIVVPANVGITFGTGEKIEGDSTDLTVTSGGALNLTATTDVVIPANVGITFGTGEKIEGDNTDLTITSGALINLSATSDIVIPTNVGLHFTDANEKIESNGTDLTINSGADINLTATADVNLPNNIGLVFGDDGEKIEGNGTNLTISSSGLCTITATGQTVITNDLVVSGNLTVNGTNTVINTTTLAIEDNLIEVNRAVSANSAMPTYSGMVVNRGVSSTATEEDLFWVWDEGFADDGTTIHGNAGGAFTALRASRGVDNASPITSTETTLVDIRANVIHALATSAQYADVAERFEADAPMAVGAVVEVGGDAEITETTSEMSENVFGVISDQPAYAMNAGAGNNDSHPFVAMTGRTPVRVTGEVTKGQRLVSSTVKGCARAAATGESISPFNVIGRALESSTDAGIKLVNCAVRTNN